MDKKEYVASVVKNLATEGLLSDNDSVSLRVEGGYLITLEGKANKDITAADVVEVALGAESKNLHEAIYLNREDIGAVILNHAKNCVTVAATGKTIPAVLDDCAQIAGNTVKVSPSACPCCVVKTLKGRNACLIKDGGAVATGRTLDEAFTTSFVLEKGAKTFIETTALGGAVILPFLDAFIQRTVYKLKYSKKDQSSKI